MKVKINNMGPIYKTSFARVSYHFIKNLFRKDLFSPRVETPLGRWGLKEQQKKVDLSIMYANEDHCGICTDYAANINKMKNNKT